MKRLWSGLIVVCALGSMGESSQEQARAALPPSPSVAVTAPQPAPPPAPAQIPQLMAVPGFGYPGASMPAMGPQAFELPQVEIPMPEAPVFGFAYGAVVRTGVDQASASFMVVKDEPTGEEVTLLVDPKRTQMTRGGKPASLADYGVGDLVDVTYQWKEEQNLALFVDAVEPGEELSGSSEGSDEPASPMSPTDPGTGSLEGSP